MERRAMLTYSMQGGLQPGAETLSPSAAYSNEIRKKCQEDKRQNLLDGTFICQR